jgi:hypothetical protein
MRAACGEQLREHAPHVVVIIVVEDDSLSCWELAPHEIVWGEQL